MAREKELHRDNLERLDQFFTKELLTVKDVSKFCGISDDLARQMFSFRVMKGHGRNTYFISKVKLASELS